MFLINELIQYPALIAYLKGYSNYSWIHFSDGRKVLTAKPLCYFEKRLSGFFRSHKTVLVNPYYVESVEAPQRAKMAGSLQLRGGAVLPVGRRRWQALEELLPNLVRPESRLAARPAKPAATATGQRVLFFTRNEIRGLLIRQLMAEKWPSCTVDIVMTDSALEKYMTRSRNRPSLILLEEDDVSGNGPIGKFKMHPSFGAVPILLLVPSGSPSLVTRAYQFGVSSVVALSADPLHFMRMIEKVFRFWLGFAATLPTPPSVRSTYSGFRVA